MVISSPRQLLRQGLILLSSDREHFRALQQGSRAVFASRQLRGPVISPQVTKQNPRPVELQMEKVYWCLGPNPWGVCVSVCTLDESGVSEPFVLFFVSDTGSFVS